MNEYKNSKSKLNILIGRNGTGKSKMLSSLLKHEIKKSYTVGSHQFSRFIAISMAPFDKFPISLNDPLNKYRYLGIKNNSGSSAAKKFIRRVGVDFFEMLADSGDLYEIYDSLTKFGLDSWIEFEVKISKKLDHPKLIHLNCSEFKNYVCIDFLGDNIWKKIPKNNKTKEIFQTIEKFQEYCQAIPKKYLFDSKWTLQFGGDDERKSILGGVNYKSISILLAIGLIEITKINISSCKKVFDLCAASSGEQSIYLTLIGIASNIKNGTLILIDEPETCLHPAWQEKYVSIIDIFLEKYSNCAFWIATHSPTIVAGAKENTKIINLENNATYNNQEFSKKSSDYQLVELFESPGYRNEYLSKLILDVIKLLASTVDSLDLLEEKVEKLVKISEKLLSDDPLKEVIKAIEKSIKEKKNAAL